MSLLLTLIQLALLPFSSSSSYTHAHARARYPTVLSFLHNSKGSPCVRGFDVSPNTKAHEHVRTPKERERDGEGVSALRSGTPHGASLPTTVPLHRTAATHRAPLRCCLLSVWYSLKGERQEHRTLLSSPLPPPVFALIIISFRFVCLCVWAISLLCLAVTVIHFASLIPLSLPPSLFVCVCVHAPLALTHTPTHTRTHSLTHVHALRRTRVPVRRCRCGRRPPPLLENGKAPFEASP